MFHSITRSICVPTIISIVFPFELFNLFLLSASMHCFLSTFDFEALNYVIINCTYTIYFTKEVLSIKKNLLVRRKIFRCRWHSTISLSIALVMLSEYFPRVASYSVVYSAPLTPLPMLQAKGTIFAFFRILGSR